MYQLRFKAMLTTCVLQTYIKYFFSKRSSKTNILLLVHKLVVCMILIAEHFLLTYINRELLKTRSISLNFDIN